MLISLWPACCFTSFEAPVSFSPNKEFCANSHPHNWQLATTLSLSFVRLQAMRSLNIDHWLIAADWSLTELRFSRFQASSSSSSSSHLRERHTDKKSKYLRLQIGLRRAAIRRSAPESTAVYMRRIPEAGENSRTRSDRSAARERLTSWVEDRLRVKSRDPSERRKVRRRGRI